MTIEFEPAGRGQRALADIVLDRMDLLKLQRMLNAGVGSALISVNDDAVVVVRVEDE